MYFIFDLFIFAATGRAASPNVALYHINSREIIHHNFRLTSDSYETWKYGNMSDL